MSAPAFLRHSLVYAASQYLSRVALIARGVVAAAALGPHGYGAWNGLNLIYDYGVYASLGALQGLDLELPGTVLSQDRAGSARKMAGAWWVAAWGATLFGAAVATAIATGLIFTGMHPALPLLMVGAAWLQVAFQYLASALRAHGRFSAISAGHAVQALAGGGLGLGLVFPYGIWGLLAGWLLGTGVALAWMRRAIPEAPLAPGAPHEGVLLARAGLPIFAYFVAMLALRSVDRMALLRFGGEQPLGLYGLGLMVFGLALYLPESAGYVLFPRMAAAARGARDAEATRMECVRAQRGLCALMPLVVGTGMVAAGPLVCALLPAFRDGLPALRALALGAMFFSAATLPGYGLLAASRFRALLSIGAIATIVQAVLVATVASRSPHPTPVAVAAAAGYGLFAALLLIVAARGWYSGAAARVRSVVEGLAPGLWVGAVTIAACRFGDDASWTDALARAACVTAAGLPVLLVMTRGLGLRAMIGRLVPR